jgi:hypothetical protein
MEPLLRDMRHEDPTKRPTIDEVIERFAALCRTLGEQKLRSRPVKKEKELYPPGMLKKFGFWLRRFYCTVLRIPAIPTRYNFSLRSV